MRGRIVIGLLLAAIGLTWALSLSGITIFPGGLSVWWPTILIVFGALQLALPPRHPLVGATLVAFGALLQAWRLEMLPGVPWAYAAPVALVALGVGMLVSALTWRRRRARAYWCRDDAEWREA